MSHRMPCNVINDYRRFRIYSIENFEKSLNNTSSSICLFVKNLSDKEKSELIAGLFISDEKVITKYLYTPDVNKEKLLNKLYNFEIVKKIISIMFIHPKNDNLLPLDQRDDIFTFAMRLIPDSLIDLATKRSACIAIDKEMKDVELRVAYNESIPILKTNRYNGNIRIEEFKAIIKNQLLDQSEYILLAMGLLSTIPHNDLISKRMNVIRNFYFNLDYNEAIITIHFLCSIYKDKINSSILNLLYETESKLTPVSSNENYSRRFYENRVAAFYHSLHLNIRSISKITTFFLNKSVHSLDDAINAIITISELSDSDASKKMEALKSFSPQYQHRIKKHKPGFISKLEESIIEDTDREKTTVINAVYSRNLGIMKSSQPNYTNELSINLLRNSPSDIYFSDTDAIKNIPSFARHLQAPFVASISGHAFFLIALLEKYMIAYNKNKHFKGVNPILNFDINNFIQAYIYTYVRYGYHSILEMTLPFTEKAIQNIFNQNGVQLNLKLPESTLKLACLDSQEYTKGLLLKKALNEDLNNRWQSTQSLFNRVKRIKDESTSTSSTNSPQTITKKSHHPIS